MENNSFAAQDALAAIRGAQGSLADRLTTPAWYHPVLGALIAQFVLVHGLVARSFFTALSSLVLALGAFGLVQVYKKQTGLMAGAPVGRRSQMLMAVLALVIAGACLSVVLAEPAPAVVAVIAVAAWVGVIVIGRAYDHAYRAGLRGQA